MSLIYVNFQKYIKNSTKHVMIYVRKRKKDLMQDLNFKQHSTPGLSQ